MSAGLCLRLAGALLIMGTSAAAAGSLSARARRQLAELEGFLRLIRQIRLEIACFSRPLSEIYANFSDPALVRCGFLEALSAGGDFSHALSASEKALALSPRQLGILRELGGQLGRSYREEQLTTCDYFLAALGEEQAACAEALPKKNKLYRSLCLLCGVSVIIILI